MTDLPTITRRNHGRNHSYLIDGRKVPGVTTLIGDGLPKPALVAWGPKVCAEYVADRLDQHDGHVVADKLVADLGELARAKSKPWPDELSRTKVAELLKGVHWEDRDQAARRGTEVHSWSERVASGGDFGAVPEALTGHVNAYLKFLDDWQPTDALVELVVGSGKYQYAGTLDMIATIEPLGRCLLDIKTSRSGPFAEVALQLAGYRYADAYFDPETGETKPMPSIDWCGVIWLRADGYDLIPFEAGPAEFRQFRYVAEVGRWLKAQGDRDLPGVKGEALHVDDLEDPRVDLLKRKHREVAR